MLIDYEDEFEYVDDDDDDDVDFVALVVLVVIIVVVWRSIELMLKHEAS